MTTSVTDPNGKYLGGFACEYSGSESRKIVEESLEKSIDGMIERRGYGIVKNGMKMYQDNITSKGYKIHPGKIFKYESMDVKEKHGSVLTAICFVSYKYPTFKKSAANKKTSKTKKTRKNRKYIK